MSTQPLMQSIEALAHMLGQPITAAEFDGGWSAGGKEHWSNIVQQWKASVLSGEAPQWAPVNGKHLDNSGGGSVGDLAEQLEHVGHAVWVHYKSQPLLRRIAKRITSASSRPATPSARPSP